MVALDAGQDIAVVGLVPAAGQARRGGAVNPSPVLRQVVEAAGAVVPGG